MSPRCSASGGRARGLATLATLMLLLMASLLAAAWAQRNALNEVRTAANQAHASRAFEAAETGLAWAQAMLNGNEALGPDCRPATGAGATSFRARYLMPMDASGHVVPRTAGPAAAGLRIACLRDAGGWQCACPDDGSAPALPASDAGITPMFEVRFVAGSASGTIDVLALGCSHVGKPCVADAASRADANARLRLSLAFLPGLVAPPPATLTAVGDITAAAAASPGLYNADAGSGGLAVLAGGAIDGAAIRIGSTPGAAAGTARVAHDASLAALSADQLFARHVGLERQPWKSLPGVRRLPCTSDCSASLAAIAASGIDVARVAVDGDLALDGSVTIGTREHPVVLLVDGDLLLRGPVRLHALVFARHLRWDAVAAGAGALLHGAAVLSGGYAGDGSADLVYDSALMQRLQRRTGSWLRIPGSWRDF